MNENKNSETKMVKKKKKINFRVKRVFLLLFSLFIMGLSTGMFILYGPYSWVRETLITTAMTTMNHQYLAKWFYDDATIAKILANNHVIEPDEDTNPDLIDINNPSGKKYDSKYEKEIQEHEKDAIYKIIDVAGPGYKGYMVAVYNPAKVKLAVSSKLGITGQSTKVLAKNNNALITMNASGFYDPDWNSNGAIPHGTVIKNGKVVWDYEDAKVGGGFVGFNNDNVLVLGKNWSASKAISMGLRDAVEFGPFLVVNGKPAFVKGDGGWGIAPRTAIGQRKDGIVLMLVIDGRRPGHSIGADVDTLTEIMVNFGAVNAANMDGGSSTSLIVKDKIYNKPVAGGSEGLRNIPTAWIVTE